MTAGVMKDPSIRALARPDVDAVVAIDAQLEGLSRRSYFLRRLAAALRQPDQHVQFAAVGDDGALLGYLLARRIHGEFGRERPGFLLEVVGVRPDQGGKGVGRRLLDALIGYATRHEAHELRTGAAWNDHRMLRWLDVMGFRLASNQVIDCAVADGYREERDDALDLPDSHTAGHEVDYGRPDGNDFDRVANSRSDVRTMQPGDLAQIARIDREITGRDRETYIAGKLAEAMDDAAIRVSLTARRDDAIVGYLMARADLGDFGRTAPVAVLDTIGVDPAYARIGVGHALVSQLFENLGALHVDHVETVLAPSDFALARFLSGVGFAPSQRLAFVKELR